jgi:hypothetical protein
MDRYAFLLTAMSMADAKEVLGFPPDSDPTPQEIKEAYRSKAVKLHPDVGGDPKAMQDLNVAKDILEGKARPTYDRRDELPLRTRWEPPKKKEVTFEEARSKANIPSGVVWQFVTPAQRSTSWSSDESSQRDSSFVAYGRVDDQHVFVAYRNYTREDYYIGGTRNEDIWTMKAVKLSARKDEALQPHWLYGNVVRSLKGIGFEGRFNSKVLDAKGWNLDNRLPSGTPISIKHWLVQSGQVLGTEPSVVSRKHVVELTISGSAFDEKQDLILTLNGRPYTLSDNDRKKIRNTRYGGKNLLNVIFGDYYYDRSSKQLTRSKHGKKIIGWMATSLPDLPNEATEILKAAEAQMK